MAQLYHAPGSLGPPAEMIDPDWNIFKQFSDENQFFFLHHQRHSLRRLIKMGALKVGDGFNIHVNEQGLISAVECRPMTVDELSLPPPEIFSGIGGLERIEKKALDESLFEAEEEPDGPSPVAILIMKKLADAPPMMCLSWKKMLTELNNTPSDLHTISALVEWLNKSLREEETHWSILESFGNTLTMTMLAIVDFSRILDSICILSGVDSGDKPPIEAMQECFMFFAYDCTGLQSMQERLRDAYLGRAIQSGGATILKRFKKEWKLIIEELKPGRIGVEMRQYLGMLGEDFGPVPENSLLHTGESVPGDTISEDANTQDAESQKSDSQDFNSQDSDSEYANSEDANSEDADSEDADSEDAAFENTNSQASGTNTQESPSTESLASRESGFFTDFQELVSPPIWSDYSDYVPSSGMMFIGSPPINLQSSDTNTQESPSTESLASRDFESFPAFQELRTPPGISGNVPAELMFIEPLSPITWRSTKRKRDDSEDTDDEEDF